MGLQQKRLTTNSAYMYDINDFKSPLSENNILYIINDCLNDFNFYNSQFPKMGKAQAIIKAQIMTDKSKYRWEVLSRNKAYCSKEN